MTSEYISSIESITPTRTRFVEECSLPGESRGEGAHPSHGSGLQLSRDRFLLLFSTRGWRGVDDDHSVVYQLRRDRWDGEIVKEGFVSQTNTDWVPPRIDRVCSRQHGHVTGFGVPLGALINGQRVPHENHFAIMWRQVGRILDPTTGFLHENAHDPELWEKSSDAHWRQFRLNAAGTDLEWLNEPCALRRVGHEGDPCAIPDRPDIANMIKGFVPAVAANDDCSGWVDVNSVGYVGGATRGGYMPGTSLVTALYSLDSASGLYQWKSAGPVSARGKNEGSIARWRGQFVLMARQCGKASAEEIRTGTFHHHVNYFLTDDPVGEFPDFQPALDQPSWSPRTLFEGPDGGLWKLGGCRTHSPYAEERNPAFVSVIDPEKQFRVVAAQTICDAVETNPSIPAPWVDFPKLLPHTGGPEQWVIYRVRSNRLPNFKAAGESVPASAATPEELAAAGIYASRIQYHEPQPARWNFDVLA